MKKLLKSIALLLILGTLNYLFVKYKVCYGCDMDYETEMALEGTGRTVRYFWVLPSWVMYFFAPAYMYAVVTFEQNLRAFLKERGYVKDKTS